MSGTYEKWLLANAADLSQLYALMPWPRVSFAFWTRERFDAGNESNTTHLPAAGLCWKCSRLTPTAELTCTHCGYLNPNRDPAGAIAQQDEDHRRLSIEQLFPNGNPLTTTGLLRALDEEATNSDNSYLKAHADIEHEPNPWTQRQAG